MTGFNRRQFINSTLFSAAAASPTLTRIALAGDSKSPIVATLFNTHWHPEQTGSNEALGKNGVKIIAHTNTKLWLTRRITVGWRPGAYGPFTGKALPGETFYAKAWRSRACGDTSRRTRERVIPSPNHRVRNIRSRKIRVCASAGRYCGRIRLIGRETPEFRIARRRIPG
jgi:hypothetical protein